MRIKINFAGINDSIPINSQHIVNSFIHKCLGENNIYHDKPSDYCISMLAGGNMNSDKNTLSFKNGAYIIVSTIDHVFLNTLIAGVMKIKQIENFKFVGLEFLEDYFYDGYNHFKTFTPILLKEKVDNKVVFTTIENDNFVEKLKEQTIRTIKKINSKLDVSDLEIILHNTGVQKTKTIIINTLPNKASLCHLSIKCNKKVAELLYNIGLGHSTGSGFGMIYYANGNNKKMYSWN